MIKKNFLKGKKIIIFTCGYYGRLIFRKLNYKNKIIYFFDNFTKKKKLFNVKVKRPIFLKNEKFDFICLAGRDIKILKRQLIKLGYKKNQIIIFTNQEVRPSGRESLNREKIAIVLLKRILKSFDKLNIKYQCSYSGLLSIIREKKLSIFSDFEISLNIEDNRKLLKHFRENNFIIKYKEAFEFKNKIYKDFYLTSNKEVDEKMEYPRVSFVYCYEGKKFVKEIRKNKILNKEYFSKIKKISVKNIKFNVPYNYKNHLFNLYGANWKKKSDYWFLKKTN